MEVEVTKIGERGQLVIPQDIRENMGISKGDKFIIIERGDMIVLKKLNPPSNEEFEKMLTEGHSHAKKQNLNEQDMWAAIKRVRSKKE